MSQVPTGSLINTALQPLRTPLKDIEAAPDMYNQMADLIGKGLGLANQSVVAGVQNQQNATSLENIQNAKDAAQAHFLQSEKEAAQNLTEQGYQLEEQGLHNKAALQEADLPKMLEQAGGSWSNVLEQNPGLLRPVRTKVQTTLAQDQAEKDVAQFRAMVLLNPQKDVQAVAADFLKLKQGSYPQFDPVTKGLYDSFMQDAINKDVALKTVENAEINRMNAVDANDQHLQDNITALMQSGLLNNTTMQAVGNKYINDQLAIDNRRSDTTLRINVFNAAKKVIIGESSTSASNSIDTYNKLFPEAPINVNDPLSPLPNEVAFGDEMQRSLALALRQDVIQKYIANAQKIKDNFTTAISNDQTLSGRVKAKAQVDAASNAQIPDKTKLEINQFNIQDTTDKLQKLLDASHNEQEVSAAMAQIEQAHNAKLINDIPYQAMIQKQEALSLSLKSKNDVASIAMGAPGSNLIQLDESHDKWINEYTDALINPPVETGIVGPQRSGMSIGDAYARTLSLFGHLTKEQITGLNGLVGNPPQSTGDPALDNQIKFQRNVEAAAAFQKIHDAAPGYIDGLINDPSEGGLSAKLLAIHSAVVDQGNTATNVALWMAPVPKAVFTDAIKRYNEPNETKDIDGGLITIQKAFAGSFLGLQLPQRIDISEPDVNGVTPGTTQLTKGLYLNHYAQIYADSNGSIPPDTIAKMAFAQTKDDLPKFATNATVGNFDSVIADRTNPLAVANNPAATKAQMNMFNTVWSSVAHTLEQEYAQLRYTTTNLDWDNVSVTKDGQFYQFPVFKTDQPGGRNAPVGQFLWPVSEVDQKNLSKIYQSSIAGDISIWGGFAPDTQGFVQKSFENMKNQADKLFIPAGR